MKEKILLVYAVVVLFFGICTLLTLSGTSADDTDWLPHEIYKDSDMNILGCILLSIIYLILKPLFYIPKLVVEIIYWICHVGRKND